MTHDEIVRNQEARHQKKLTEQERNRAIRWNLFKPCFKGLHENCAKVNVFDSGTVCSCMCHGKD